MCHTRSKLYADLVLTLQAGHSQEMVVAIRTVMRLFLTTGRAPVMVSTTQGIMADISVDSTSTTAGVTAIAIEWHHHQVGESGLLLAW